VRKNERKKEDFQVTNSRKFQEDFFFLSLSLSPLSFLSKSCTTEEKNGVSITTRNPPPGLPEPSQKRKAKRKFFFKIKKT